MWWRYDMTWHTIKKQNHTSLHVLYVPSPRVIHPHHHHQNLIINTTLLNYIITVGKSRNDRDLWSGGQVAICPRVCQRQTIGKTYHRSCIRYPATLFCLFDDYDDQRVGPYGDKSHGLQTKKKVRHASTVYLSSTRLQGQQSQSTAEGRFPSNHFRTWHRWYKHNNTSCPHAHPIKHISNSWHIFSLSFYLWHRRGICALSRPHFLISKGCGCVFGGMAQHRLSNVRTRTHHRRFVIIPITPPPLISYNLRYH